MGELTQQSLKEVFYYCPCSGLFKWKRKRKGVRQGAVAGTIGKDGYRIIMFNGANYYAHRLAWFYVYGTWPENDLDHSDAVRSNECFFNFRPATRGQNMQNGTLRSNNTSGYKGVAFHYGTMKWRAYIKRNGMQIALGLFFTKEDAALAYNKAAKELFGEFARVNTIREATGQGIS